MQTAAEKQIKRVLGPCVDRLVFLDDQRLKFIQKILGVLPDTYFSRFKATIARTRETLAWVGGVPTEMGLPMAYWKSKSAAPKSDLDPARDRCGLHWYAPVVPMLGRDVDEFIQMVKNICTQYHFESPINLVSMGGGNAFCSTIPILFSGDDEGQNERARACYRELFSEGVERGFIPYRIGSEFMELLPSACDDVYWRLNETLKRAADPNRIIAPGRYCSHNPAL